MAAPRRDARPLTEFLEDAPAFSRRLRETGEPVVLAVDGGAEVVVQDAESYRKLLDEIERARDLEGIRRGLEDMRAGRTLPLDEVFAGIRRELGLPPAR